MPTFGRLLTAMVTPMTPDGAVDLKRAGELAKHLVAAGSEGLVVSGTTGESPTLSHEEKLRLFEAVVDAVGDRVPVIAGTGSNNTAETVRFSREAARTGVHGLLLVTPYYNKPPQEGLYRHFRAVAEAVEIPCIPYNVPGRTSVNMTAETTVRLARDVKNIIGIKECADVGQLAEILRGAPEGFLVWSGEDANLLPYLTVGAYGIISVASHVVGPQMQELIQAFLAGDTAQAAAWHRRLLPVFRGLFAVTNPILVKAALNMTGFPVGPVRLPLVDATEAQKEALRAALAEAGVL
ncbi:4-hydroxy-tetrahydrodipicolinate synthase [Symbiobacterium terraclitae]|uniref:4-hydroxy-tetrahydrodipicolinate synthase n=1 Tax=Symbiobacterium terraclitae TaxID=557451 RepID=A0ABS4JQ26_9FIRM|nr:4-hydroxy-tetrahydrodipicolinate synthase [Symbiobacterium terraclitae]